MPQLVEIRVFQVEDLGLFTSEFFNVIPSTFWTLKIFYNNTDIPETVPNV